MYHFPPTFNALLNPHLRFSFPSGFNLNEFDKALGASLPQTIIVGFCCLVFAAVSGVVDSLLKPSGFVKKAVAFSSVLIYASVAIFIFGISLVSNPRINLNFCIQIFRSYFVN